MLHQKGDNVYKIYKYYCIGSLKEDEELEDFVLDDITNW